MEFALLIYVDETTAAAPGSAELEERFAAYRAYTASLKEAGTFRASVKLTGTTTATSVRLRKGQVLTTDGPFAETKEQLAGLYIVECESLDEALERAAHHPGARFGTIEVRPIDFRG
jgi:hypothetical protein